MKKVLSLVFLILILSKDKKCSAQKFADKEYYLIDSLVLEELSEDNLEIIEEALELFTSTTKVSKKRESLFYIIDNCYDPFAWVLYNEFSNEFAKKQLKKNKFISNSEKKEMVSFLGLTQYYKGYTDDVRGDAEKSIFYYKKSLATYKSINDKEGVAMCMENIGAYYFQTGSMNIALECFHKGVKLSTEIGYLEGLANNNRALGDYFYTQKEFDKALKIYKECLLIFEELEEDEAIGYCITDIGRIYEVKDSLDLALKAYNKSLKIHQNIGDQIGIANSLKNIAYIKYRTENKDEALSYYNRSLKIYKEIPDALGVSSCLYYLGEIYFNDNNVVEAKKSTEISLKIAQQTSYIGYVDQSAELLSKIYKKQGKGMQALEMYELHILMRDSANNIEAQKASIKQQAKYEYEKKKMVDDAENDKLVAIEKEAKKKQKVISYAIAGGLGLTGVFLFFVFNRLRVTRKQKIIIENQKEEVEVQKNEAENQRDIANHQKLIVEIKNKEITESITYAKRIQEAILPPPRLVKEWLTESFIFYKPKDIVAGDFYWMETVTYKVDDREKTLVYFAAADCTGHGVPGAMVSVVCANALNRAVKEFGLIEPGHVLDKVTELVIEAFDKGDEEIKDGMDIALCALDISAKKVFYSGANNPLYRITSIKEKVNPEIKTEANNTHQLIEYKATKQPVGQCDNLKKFETIEIQLEPGDAIYVFSDGFPDQFGGVKGKKYKYSSFRKSLLANFHHPMETQKQLLETEFNDWKGDLEQIDDVCVIGVRVNGKEKKNFTTRELEVLNHLQEGLSSKLIADKMCISKHTVDTYRRRLLAKTGTYNSTELINYCIKKEII